MLFDGSIGFMLLPRDGSFDGYYLLVCVVEYAAYVYAFIDVCVAGFYAGDLLWYLWYP